MHATSDTLYRQAYARTCENGKIYAYFLELFSIQSSRQPLPIAHRGQASPQSWPIIAEWILDLLGRFLSAQGVVTRKRGSRCIIRKQLVLTSRQSQRGNQTNQTNQHSYHDAMINTLSLLGKINIQRYHALFITTFIPDGLFDKNALLPKGQCYA